MKTVNDTLRYAAQFYQKQVTSLREKVKKPETHPGWNKVLAEAEKRLEVYSRSTYEGED